jgi:hypothetical protein
VGRQSEGRYTEYSRERVNIDKIGEVMGGKRRRKSALS